LHRSLSESLFSHDDGTLMILQCTRHDLRSGGRTRVNQNNDWSTVQNVVRRRAEPHLGIFDTAVGVNDQSALQKGVTNRYRRIENSARIIPQIQHDTLQVTFLFEFTD